MINALVHGIFCGLITCTVAMIGRAFICADAKHHGKERPRFNVFQCLSVGLELILSVAFFAGIAYGIYRLIAR